ncbi:MAG TPA: hypothetical protein VEC19_18300 [Usitatibacter sp.]|nr:hypothetical protein [Usitatibacter sp.]
MSSIPLVPQRTWINGFFAWLDGDMPEPQAAPTPSQPSPTRIFGTAPRSRTRGVEDQAANSRVDFARLLEAAKVAPDLAPLEWDGDRPAANDEFVGTRSPCAGQDASCDWDPQRRRIRERYLCARFPGVMRAAADLQRADEVIKSSRLFFEDGQPALALELLEMAIEDSPAEPGLWLARLEILFLLRDADGYARVAREFRALHGAHEAWPEVQRLGRALAPRDPFFGMGGEARAHEHYGPWPDLPNWIRAPWDLTAEVLAADFHRAVRGLAPLAA